MIGTVIDDDTHTVSIVVPPHLIRTRIAGVAQTVTISIPQLQGFEVGTQIDRLVSRWRFDGGRAGGARDEAESEAKCETMHRFSPNSL